MRENEEKVEEKLNFDNYKEAKMEREVKCKKEVKPIVNEIKDEELLKVISQVCQHNQLSKK